MPRDYQRKRTKYILPKAVYHQALWIIRDYQRMKDRMNDKLGTKSQNLDGMPHGKWTTDPTFEAAAIREDMAKKISAIDRSLQLIPPEYRKGIWENIQYGSPFPEDAPDAESRSGLAQGTAQSADAGSRISGRTGRHIQREEDKR